MIQLNSAVRLLDEAAEKFGSRTAVEDERGEMSFSDLRKKGRAIATAILSDQTNELAPVMVYLSKGAECIACFMGAMYSANPYVPIAYDMPPNRIRKIVDSLEGHGHIITDESGLAVIEDMGVPSSIHIHIYGEAVETEINEESADKALASVIDTDPIYIMFTSGSTGEPKGVTVPHRGVIDYAMWVADTFNLDENSILGNQAPFYFDNSIFDIYSMLLTGAKMIIIPETLFMFPSKLPEFISDNHITTIFWVPTVIINAANSGALSEVKLTELKNVVFCGEVMPNKQLNIWRKNQPQCLYANLYGPTEISDVCSYYIVDREFNDSDPLPIGKACENMRIIILNEENKIADVNEQGEICVIGTGVSLGYWNAPELTRRAFVQNPVNPYYSERIYRTGDLAYVNDEGLIIFIGRRDNQVKVKGNRIELGEIENAAMCAGGIRGACAVYHDGAITLFAESCEALTLRRVNKELKKFIPQYMLPGRLVVMDKFPHTANDKIDRTQLKKSLEVRG